MTNLSSLTRAEQVLQKLEEANGQWVDGADLANAEVGGSEGLKRLRELRDKDHWDIRKRQKPESDQYQYRLVMIDGIPQKWGGTPVALSPAPDRSSTEADGNGRSAGAPAGAPHLDAPAQASVEPAETYDYKPKGPVVPGRAHLGKTASGEYVMVRDAPEELPGQTHAFGDDEVPIEGNKFTANPGALELGKTILCPRCHGVRRAIKERDPVTNKQMKNGRILSYEDWCRDPKTPSQPCMRCDGYGVVPK